MRSRGLRRLHACQKYTEPKPSKEQHLSSLKLGMPTPINAMFKVLLVQLEHVMLASFEAQSPSSLASCVSKDIAAFEGRFSRPIAKPGPLFCAERRRKREATADGLLAETCLSK